MRESVVMRAGIKMESSHFSMECLFKINAAIATAQITRNMIVDCKFSARKRKRAFEKLKILRGSLIRAMSFEILEESEISDNSASIATIAPIDVPITMSVCFDFCATKIAQKIKDNTANIKATPNAPM